MSHFTVLVIGDNPEERLAPFQENNMENCPKKYLEFFDKEDEYRKQYENEGVEKVVMPDGRLLNTWDNEFRVPGTIGIGSNSHKVPKHLKTKQVPFKELYDTFEKFMSEYCGYKKRDPKKNRYGYWENPQAKWDWYQLGGRWRGLFKMKECAKQLAVVGEPGVPELFAMREGKGRQIPEGRTDQAYKRDIDFAGMYDEAADKAAKHYDEIARLFGGTIPRPTKTWAEYLKEGNKKDIDKTRKKYHSQKALRKLAELRKSDKLTAEEKDLLGGWGFDLEDYMDGREAYIARAIENACCTFAVIKDGKWYERGEMGWWGMVRDEKDRSRWASEVKKLLDETPDDTLLSVYDCHI